jgi:hypothetical protein
MAGFGLKTSGAEIAVDTEASFTWTGMHAFARPVAFSSDQKLAIEALFHPRASRGDLLFQGAKHVELLKLGAAGTTLISSGASLQWGYIDLNSHVTGVLPIRLGGTGWTAAPEEGLIASDGHRLWSLSPGPEGSVLTVSQGALSWQLPKTLQGSGDADALAIWKRGNALSDSSLHFHQEALVWGGASPAIVMQAAIPGGLEMLHEGRVVRLHANLSERQRLAESAGGALQISLENDLATWSLVWAKADGEPVTVASWSNQGVLTQGTVPIERLAGVLSPDCGGTGIAEFAIGDILYAVAPNRLARLSTKGKEGCLLGVVNGLPAWVKGASAEVSAKSTDSPSSLELDEKRLWYREGKKRKALVLHGDDIEGKAAGLSRVLEVGCGGTGADLSNITQGSLIVSRGPGAMGGLVQGPKNTVLASDGAGRDPVWQPVVMSVNAQGGILRSGSDTEVTLEIDASNQFNPVWRGDHLFAGEVGFARAPLMAKGLALESDPVPRSPQTGDLWREGDQLYYRTERATVCLSESSAPIQEPRQTHYLRIACGETMEDGMIQRVRTLIPHSTSKPLSGAQWRIVRLDILCEEPPQEEGALIDVIAENGSSILLEPVQIEAAARRGFTVHFQQSILDADETLRLVVRRRAGGDLWSAWVLLEEAR